MREVHTYLGRLAITGTLLWSGLLSAAVPDQGIVSIGSDTLEDVVAAWGESFIRDHPELSFDMRAEGSNTAPAALTEGASNVAPMSRRMTAEEIAAFREARGYEPTAIRVGLDALAVFVNADNPIEGLSMGQVDAIFSKTRSCSGGFFADWDNVERWSDVTFGDFGEMKIYGRDDRSGTNDFFVEVALCGGEFKEEVRELTDSRAVVEAVAANRNAIGYAGIGFRAEGVKPLALASGPSYIDGTPYYGYEADKYRNDPDPERRYMWVMRGAYPLSRYLYLYVDLPPGSRLDPTVARFVDLALSAEGQRILLDQGFIPLQGRVLRQERDGLGRSIE